MPTKAADLAVLLGAGAGTIGSSVTVPAAGITGTLGSGVVFPTGMIIGSGTITDTATRYETSALTELTCPDITCTIVKKLATSHILVMGKLDVGMYQAVSNASARGNWWFDRTAPSIVTDFCMSLVYITDEDNNDPYHQVTHNSAVHFVDTSTGTTGSHTYVCHLQTDSNTSHKTRINHPDISGTERDGHALLQAFEIAQ